MLSVDAARERVLAAVAPVDPVEVLVGDALGLVLARDAHASHPLPRFDNSAMDGYAVRSEDVASAEEGVPVYLDVLGEVRAGSISNDEVRAGGALRIMTGAPVPPGADAVVPVEVTEETGTRVAIKQAPQRGAHVRPAGEDLAEGDLLVAVGTELGSGELALLASMGFSPLLARRGPKVAILVTGDELVPPEASPGPGQIRDSNSIALAALVEEAGGQVLPFAPVPDDRAAVKDAFARAGKLADLVVSSGGVAVGRYDFVKEVIEELGGIDMWRVAMQPGKPVVLGRIGATPFLGLPGNPVSIHIAFEQFVRPAIRKMRGCTALLRPTIPAALAAPIDKKPGRRHFVRVGLHRDGDRWVASPRPQGSHIQSSLVDCHGVAIVAEEIEHLGAGEIVSVEVWGIPSEGSQ